MMKMYQPSVEEERESEKQMRQFEEEDLLSREINVHHLLNYLKTMKSIPGFLKSGGNVYGKNKFVRYVLSFVKGANKYTSVRIIVIIERKYLNRIIVT